MKKIFLSAVIALLLTGITTGTDNQIGTIGSIDIAGKEIIVKVESEVKLMMGDMLEVRTDSGKITLIVTFPMQTLVKCKIKDKGKLSKLTKDMEVFKYSKETDDNGRNNSTADIGITEKFGNIEMVEIPGGAFIAGSPDSEKDRQVVEDQRSVTLPAFWIGRHEVSQKDYADVMGINPSKVKGENLPVENVKWYDAIEFCNKLSIKHGFKPYYAVKTIDRRRIRGEELNNTMNYAVTAMGGDGFHLPTEAEWEYACRGGTTTPFYFGDKLNSSMANFNGNSPYNSKKGLYRGKTTPAGSFKPNAYGLFDMHGNVAEWCFSNFGTDISDDSKVAGNSPFITLRGGSWFHPGKELRSAFRGYGNPSEGYGYTGFRVARSPSR